MLQFPPRDVKSFCGRFSIVPRQTLGFRHLTPSESPGSANLMKSVWKMLQFNAGGLCEMIKYQYAENANNGKSMGSPNVFIRTSGVIPGVYFGARGPDTEYPTRHLN